MAEKRIFAGVSAVLFATILLAGCGQRGLGDPSQETALDILGSESVFMTVGEGTILRADLQEPLSSDGSRVGQVFTAVVLDDVYVDDELAIPMDSIVRGVVSEAQEAKRGAGGARLSLQFTQLELPDGYVTGIVASLDEASESKKKRNGAIIGGSAAGGALLGRLLGKDTKGAVAGTIVGGAIGTGVVLSREGEQVSLPRGTELVIRLDRPARIERAA